ncbi:DUF4249 domain-containing protein [Spirosoma flavum]|uniref:DUF4249 domain-containing protein n=1 Tax=Spirosoma flavum TaxID=2048557 RepID=A0ABW6AR86_9BACT
MKLLLTLVVSSLLFIACENNREEVQPAELTAQAGQLVVNCFISPQDTMLTAKVTRSRPVLDNDPLKSVEITNALVQLTNGTQSVTLVYNSQLQYYRASATKMPIRANTTYTLIVHTPDGNQVTAVTNVPQAIPLKTVRLDSALVTEADKSVQKQFSVVCTWQDAGTTTNFYQVQGNIKGVQRELPATASAVNLGVIPFIMTDNSLGLVNNKGVNALLSVSAYLWDKAGITAINKRYRSTAVTVSLLHVNEAYYRYHEAVDRQLQASSNPFAEPVLIPSNIVGGLGCFGSYNRSSSVAKM